MRGMNADESIPDTAMQAQAVNRRQAFIDCLADQCMGELVAARGVELRLNDARLYGRFEAVQHAVQILVHGGSDFTGRELTAVDRRDTEQFVAPIRETNQPPADGLVYAGWNERGHRCDCSARSIIYENLDQLDGEQGISICLLINHLGRRLRQADVAQSLGDLADGNLRESSKMNALRIGIATQTTEGAQQWCLS